MNKKIKFLLPLIIIIATILTIKVLMDNPPKSQKKRTKNNRAISIDVMKLQKKEFTVSIDSYGLVDAISKTDLKSEVSGKVVYISEKLLNGAFFKEGDLLVEIENINYKADVQIARSKLILAQQKLIEEKAHTKQAKEEWENLGLKTKPNALVLRTPQLKTAQANVLASQAQLEKAKFALNKTKIKAPYNGRVISKHVDIAQVVSNNNLIAKIYTTGAFDIRLPIKNRDLPLLDIKKDSKVKFESQVTDNIFDGKVVRSESHIDTNSAQLYVIATITPNEKIKLGEYLNAKIVGKTISDALVVPISSLYQGSSLYIEKEGRIFKKTVQILWQDNKYALIKSGLKEQDNIVLTILGNIKSGTVVNVNTLKHGEL